MLEEFERFIAEEMPMWKKGPDCIEADRY